MKKLIAASVLTLALSVSVASQELKPYEDLTPLQKETFKFKALVVADPSYGRELLLQEGYSIAYDIEDYSAIDTMVFAGCFADQFVDYYGNLNVLVFMGLTDDDILAHLANYSFTTGVVCAYEVDVNRKEQEGI